MALCSNCGAEAGADARFCASCGNKLDGDERPPIVVGHVPSSTWVRAWAAAAVALLVAVIAVGFISLGSPPRGGDFPPGTLTVSGVDATSAGSVKVDLSKPVPVSGRLPAGVPAIDAVKLTLSAADIELGSATNGASAAPDGSFKAVFRATGGRYLVAGRAAARISLLRGDATVAHQSFVLRSHQVSLATLPALVSVLSLYPLLSRMWWLARSLRRGRRRRSGPVRLAFLGGVTGVVFLGIPWFVVGKVPVLSTIIAVAILGAVSGLCAGIVAIGVGGRRRGGVPPGRAAQTSPKAAIDHAGAR